jgi:hypothetical protein
MGTDKYQLKISVNIVFFEGGLEWEEQTYLPQLTFLGTWHVHKDCADGRSRKWEQFNFFFLTQK